MRCSGSYRSGLFFEHRSELVSEAELDLCYNWIDSLMNKYD